jgi:hypothetical protein
MSFLQKFIQTSSEFIQNDIKSSREWHIMLANKYGLVCYRRHIGTNSNVHVEGWSGIANSTAI